jgi:hypothetical protein
MQSDIRELTSMMQYIRNAILPKAPPLPPRYPFTYLRINDDLSSLTSAPPLLAEPSSPPRKKINRGDESPSKSLHLTTGDQKNGLDALHAQSQTPYPWKAFQYRPQSPFHTL